MEKTPTIEEANRLVEKYLAEARSVLPGTLSTEPHYKETSGICGGNESDMVLATDSFKVSDLTTDQISKYFSMLREWWTHHDYRILENRGNEYLWVEHNSDGFRLTLKSNKDGEIYLISTSPCVWPNGTPSPES